MPGSKIFAGSLMKRKEGNVFRNFLAEHILILPGILKIGERGENLQKFS